MTEVRAGSRLGPYEIVSRLGAGGMGEVWRAKDTRLDRAVAVKTLPAQLANNAQLRLRFEREAKTISQLNHPNICTIYDVGDDYLVMELLEGESLADRVAKGPLPIDMVLKIGVEIATALDRAHRAGIVHRDLKPANVMLTKSGAKLLDFGLAKSNPIAGSADEATMQKSLTAEGTIIGTFQYMAPEQLEAIEADARTDIFALGCVLYEMATGHRAFDGKTKTSLIAAIVNAQPAPISSIQPLTPPAFEHVVAKCLAKDPDDRWQSAHDIAEELKWLRDTSSSGVRSPIRTATLNRMKMGIAALAVVALAAAAVAVSSLRRAPGDPHFVMSLSMPASAHISVFGQAAFSPDGSRIAFAALSTDTGKPQLWVRDLSQRDARPLAGTENAFQPFWSPDGANLGFFADDKLKRIPAGGGPAQALAPAPNPYGGTWSADGTILFSYGSVGTIFRMPASGGTPTSVTKLQPNDEAHRWPWFLPDGDHFLFLADAARTEHHLIRVGSLKTGQVRDLFIAVSNIRYVEPGWLLFVRGGSLLAQRFDLKTLNVSGDPKVVADDIVPDYDNHSYEFGASSNGRLFYRSASSAAQLQFVDRQGKTLQLLGQPAHIGLARLSPDGRTIVYEQYDADGRGDDLWLLDIARNAASRLTTDPASDVAPAWSPDGKQIAFMSMRSGMGDLYVCDVRNPSIVRKVTTSQGGVSPSQWTNDGTLLLDDAAGNGTNIVTFSLSKGTKTPYVTGVAFSGRLSPNGKQITYAAVVSGQPEIFVEDFPTHDSRRQISVNGGYLPLWRGDGKELFYESNDRTLMSVDMSTESSTPKPLFPLGGGGYDVTPDGQRFVTARPLVNREAEPLTIETSWLSRIAQ